MISPELIHIIKTTFQLNWKGVHGLPHWARVRVNGLLIAKDNGANQRAVYRNLFQPAPETEQIWKPAL